MFIGYPTNVRKLKKKKKLQIKSDSMDISLLLENNFGFFVHMVVVFEKIKNLTKIFKFLLQYWKQRNRFLEPNNISIYSQKTHKDLKAQPL